MVPYGELATEEGHGWRPWNWVVDVDEVLSLRSAESSCDPVSPSAAMVLH